MSVIDRVAGWVYDHTAAGSSLQKYLHDQQAVDEADARAEAYRAGLEEGLDPAQLYDHIYGRQDAHREEPADDSSAADVPTDSDEDADVDAA